MSEREGAKLGVPKDFWLCALDFGYPALDFGYSVDAAVDFGLHIR